MTAQPLLRSLTDSNRTMKRNQFQTIRLWDNAKRCEEEKKQRGFGVGVEVRAKELPSPLPLFLLFSLTVVVI